MKKRLGSVLIVLFMGMGCSPPAKFGPHLGLQPHSYEQVYRNLHREATKDYYYDTPMAPPRYDLYGITGYPSYAPVGE